MIHQLLFISLAIILVMLAVMTCVTYYFREKDKYVRSLIVDSIKAAETAVKNAADDIRTIKAKEKEGADKK